MDLMGGLVFAPTKHWYNIFEYIWYVFLFTPEMEIHSSRLAVHTLLLYVVLENLWGRCSCNQDGLDGWLSCREWAHGCRAWWDFTANHTAIWFRYPRFSSQDGPCSWWVQANHPTKARWPIRRQCAPFSGQSPKPPTISRSSTLRGT